MPPAGESEAPVLSAVAGLGVATDGVRALLMSSVMTVDAKQALRELAIAMTPEFFNHI